jgi:predicted DNA-binding transcriptional regulator YafY
MPERDNMRKSILKYFNSNSYDSDYCLEWLKDQLYPDGIKCPVCKRVTGHSLLSKKHCYVCNNCGNQVSPTAGTIFYKSKIPLNIWFEIITRFSESRSRISAREIQRQYDLTYKTAWRLVDKVKYILKENSFKLKPESKTVILPTADSSVKPVSLTLQDVRTPLETPVSRQSWLALKPDEDSRKLGQKTDRTARLLRLQMLLCQFPRGLKINEISSKCSVSRRTVYRDLKTLESELKIPMWEKDGMRGISEGYFLPPIHFTLEELINIYLVARVMQNFTYMYVPSIAATFTKLNTIVPEPLKGQIRDTLDYMEKLPNIERQVNNISKLIKAWLSHHRVKLTYKHLTSTYESSFEPYVIEPSVSNMGGLFSAIGYCHAQKTISAFDMSEIVGDVNIEADTFEIPENFHSTDYVSAAWGVHFDEEDASVVKLRFVKNVSQSIQETRFHVSQKVEVQSDNSVIMTLKIRISLQFCHWLMSWGDYVEVLEPKELRDRIQNIAVSIANIYRR